MSGESLSRVEQPTPQERRYAELARRMYEIRDERDAALARLRVAVEVRRFADETLTDAQLCYVDGGHEWRGGGVCIRCGEKLRCGCGQFVTEARLIHHLETVCPMAAGVGDEKETNQ